MPRILLIRNYVPDKQESMQRFAAMLERGLPEQGWDVTVTEPPVRMGAGKDTTHGKGKWLGYVDKYLLARKSLRNFAMQSKADIVHVCDHSNAMYLPLFKGMPRLITCHDLLAVRCWLGEIPGERKSFTGGQQQRWILENLRRAPWVVCDSGATRDDLLRLAPQTAKRHSIIPVGLNHPFRPLGEGEVDERMRADATVRTALYNGDTRRPFIFHIGGNVWYKNKLGVVAIFKELLQQQSDLPHRLVMAGPPPPDDVREAAAELGERVCFLDKPDTDLVEALYSTASCFVFPSLAEGFGWPPIEAQACGCPVAVSDLEPLSGNCGEAAVRFDPQQPAEAARAILPLLTDPAHIQAAREASLCNAKRFTPEAMVAAYVQLYQKLLDENPASG